MKHLLLVTAMAAASLLSVAVPAHADKQWVDVTETYLTNPGFTGSSTKGWTWEASAGGRGAACDAMEFWYGTFDIHQTVSALPKGHYRMSVSAYFRCQNNDAGYRAYKDGTENITGYMYAGSHEQTLVSVYSWSSSESFSTGTWSPSWVTPQVWFPNSMESGTAAFAQGAYQNQMEFDHEGGNINIGLKNATNTADNWCLFDDFRLECYTEITPITAISLSTADGSFVVGETRQMTATVTPADATIQKLEWTSSNTDVATVDKNGTVTAVAEGTAVITATATDGSGVSSSLTVSVEHNKAKAGSLVINEVMASNIDQFVSPAFNFDGWVELYNPTDKAVELSGIYISDNSADLKQWCTPATIGAIPAHGFKTVWFDSNALNGNQAPFKLDVDGGSLYISDDNGDMLAEVDYPEGMQRVSYARTTDGGDTWGLTSTPTPAASNASADFATEQLDAPAVDTDSRLFTSAFQAQVTIPEGATLRYTTDGTLPTLANGATSETGLFDISQTAIYRFRLFQSGKLASTVTTRSYIYKDKDYALPVVSVVADPDFLYDDSLGVYVKGTNGRPGNGYSTACNWNMDWERPVNLSWITADNEMGLNQDVNLEMCGGWSRAYSPHSFKLKGEKKMGGNKNLDYPFFTAKPYIRNRTLQIRNGGNDTSCRIKDAALETIAQTSGIDLDIQSYQPAHEFINGKYIGVLNVREPNNKHYVYANYGWDDDEIDQFEMSPDSGYVQKCGTDEAFNTWYNLSANAADEATYEEIKNLVDIDEYINYMALELYLGNTDWPRNNIKGFRQSPDGRFRFVSFDLDNVAINTSSAFTDFMNMKNWTFDQLYGCSVSRITAEIKLVTIFQNMLKNDTFKKRFIDTYCLMGGSVFEATRCSEVIDSLTAIAGPQMALNNESPYSTSNWLKSSLANRLSTATNAMCNYSEMGLSASNAQTATLSSSAEGASLYINGLEVPTGYFNGHLFAPVTLRAEAPAGYTFRGWKDANISMKTLFTTGAQWNYYDQGSLDNAAWTSTSYTKNSSWKTGYSPLGYGKDDVKTTLDYGTDASNKRPTYYFRRNVPLSVEPSASDVFRLDYTVDDGFVVYVNGTEAGRYNQSQTGYSAYSDTYANGNPDSGSMTLSASLFKKGSNVIAVEVHNNNASSSDIYWAAALYTTVGTSGSNSYYSTDQEIEMPTGNFSLIADYEPMDDALSEGFTPVRINEISAANDIFVNEYGKKGDWVELYNTTSEPIDVEGMYLTDNLSKRQKCQLSKGSTTAVTVIPAHGYMVVWCDKRDTQRDLHASFKLSDDGGYVALSAADLSWTDSLSYPAHDGYHTVGRYTDGGNDIYLMNYPTIGKKNILSSYNEYVAHQTPTDIEHNTVSTHGKMTMSYASGQLFLHGRDNKATVEIFTLGGQKVATVVVNMNNGMGIVPTSTIQAGCYVAKAIGEAGNIATCKFAK
jgi:hypothetical protein